MRHLRKHLQHLKRSFNSEECIFGRFSRIQYLNLGTKKTPEEIIHNRTSNNDWHNHVNHDLNNFYLIKPIYL
jgi:hypothetical protein